MRPPSAPSAGRLATTAAALLVVVLLAAGLAWLAVALPGRYDTFNRTASEGVTAFLATGGVVAFAALIFAAWRSPPHVRTAFAAASATLLAAPAFALLTTSETTVPGLTTIVVVSLMVSAFYFTLWMPPLLAGAWLCGRQHRGRPLLDLLLWASVAVLFLALHNEALIGALGDDSDPAIPLRARILGMLPGIVPGLLAGWLYWRLGTRTASVAPRSYHPKVFNADAP